MSVETLKADLKANLATLAALDPMTTSPGDLVRHLKDTVWPFLESIVDETADIDDCVADLVSGAEDILQPETAEVFAAVIAGAVAVSAALRARLTPAEAQLLKICAELEGNCRSAEEIMKEVVIDTGDDDETEDADDDEDDLEDDEDPEDDEDEDEDDEGGQP